MSNERILEPIIDKLKLGLVDYLNALPIYYAILKGEFQLPCDIVKATPVILNQKIARGELDISLVSSFEYAQRSQRYYLLPQLSISADGPVRSIYLFTQTPLKSLKGNIYLTPNSYTSIHLVRYLLRKQNVGYIYDRKKASGDLCGEMLIGDEAIHKYHKHRFPYAYDLSQLWKEETGLPFVFAVWVVRREVFEKNPELVRQICGTLIQSRRKADELYHQMAGDHYRELFPTIDDCLSYLKNLRYDFSSSFQEGFLFFQKCCYELGFQERVSPLEFIELKADEK